jgi:hypothetical protein
MAAACSWAFGETTVARCCCRTKWFTRWCAAPPAVPPSSPGPTAHLHEWAAPTEDALFDDIVAEVLLLTLEIVAKDYARNGPTSGCK